MDSNHDKGLQRALCYHYTIGQYAGKVASFPGCAKQIFRFNVVEIRRLDSCHSTPDTCPMSSYWLVKQEPAAYSWQTFLKEKRAAWTGVRNFQARNNLRAMAKGDVVLFYHSVSDKQVVGIARVAKESYPDPTAEEGDWVAVDLVPIKSLKAPVALEQIKKDNLLKQMLLVRQSRLSVTPLTETEFERILELAETSV
jgi:predicted RNA-binding protein with PUA-like domain